MIKIMHNRLGMVDLHVAKVDRAVSEYDERLYLDRHPENGDWVIMIKMERPSDPYPVLGLQYDLPDVRDVIQRLRESDSTREDIRQRIIKFNEAKAKEVDYKVKENVGAGAELADFISRKEYRSPETKSYRKVTRKKKPRK